MITPDAPPTGADRKPDRAATARAIRIGLLAWPTAIAVYILHITRALLATPRGFDLVSVWLIVAGAVALHAAALRTLTRWFSARTLTQMSVACTASAILFSAMVAVGRIDPTPSDLLVGVALFLVPAVVGVNAADTLSAMDRARPPQAASAREKLLEVLDSFDNLTPEQIAGCSTAIQAIVAARLQREQPTGLHVVHSEGSLNGIARRSLQAGERPAGH